MSHATPDVELAEAQMALGRPDLADQRGPEAESDNGELDYEPAPDEEEAFADDDGGDSSPPGGTLAVPGAPTPAERPRGGSRLINFLQGSWRELQRVQWPDRRQVMQATGVVIGFVIVAGVFLGVADWAAGHVMNYILTGHG